MNWNQCMALFKYFAESMQHAFSMSSTYSGSCTSCFSRICFWWESFLNISNHWPMKWPTAHLHISLFDLVNPLISANSCPGWHNCSLLRLFSQLALKIWPVWMCFWFAHIWEHLSHYKLHSNYQSIMMNPVYLLTVQEAHKEDGSNMGQVRAIRLGQVWVSWHLFSLKQLSVWLKSVQLSFIFTLMQWKQMLETFWTGFEDFSRSEVSKNIKWSSTLSCNLHKGEDNLQGQEISFCELPKVPTRGRERRSVKSQPTRVSWSWRKNIPNFCGLRQVLYFEQNTSGGSKISSKAVVLNKDQRILSFSCILLHRIRTKRPRVVHRFVARSARPRLHWTTTSINDREQGSSSLP